MAARNPFEQLLNNDRAETDQARPAPRDLMADAYLSELLARLSDVQRRGYLPSIMGGMVGRERNGLPHDHGLRGTADTYDAVSQYPAAINPFAMGNRGQVAFEHGSARSYAPSDMMARGPMPDDESAELMPDDEVSEGEYPDDPFDPSHGIDTTQFDQFDLDAATEAGTDGDEQPLTPFDIPKAKSLQLTPMPQVKTDPGLDKLRQAIRPGYAQMSTYGYSQPNSDPYAEDLTALLRRLVRSA